MIRGLSLFSINSFKRYVRSVLWIINNYGSFKKVLKKQGFKEIEISNLLSWHDGFYYFYASKLGEKVFIKTDFNLGMLSNELNAIKLINNERNLFKVPEVIGYSLGDKYDFLALKYIDAIGLNKREAVEWCNQHKDKTKLVFENILDVLIENKIVHRDIKPDNIFVDIKNEDIYLIDFYFSISTNSKELTEVSKDNVAFLSNLGEDYKFRNYVWDDAYSFLKMSEDIELEINLSGIENKTGKFVYSYHDK